MECERPNFRISSSSSVGEYADKFVTTSSAEKGSTVLRVRFCSLFSCTAFEQIHYLASKKIKNKHLSGQLASELSHLCHSYVSSWVPKGRQVVKGVLKECCL